MTETGTYGVNAVAMSCVSLYWAKVECDRCRSQEGNQRFTHADFCVTQMVSDCSSVQTERDMVCIALHDYVLD